MTLRELERELEEFFAQQRFAGWDQHRRMYNAMQLVQAHATLCMLQCEADLQNLATRFPQFS